MNDNQMSDRQDGFMIAIGLLLGNTDPSAKAEILKTLESFGDDLYLELDKQSYAATAADDGVNPCGPGYHWDPVVSACVQN